MNRLLLFLSLTLLVWLSASAQPDPTIAQINSLRDDVYSKLQNHQISTEKAEIIYKNEQKRLFEQQKYPFYIQMYLFKAVDFYVTNDDYEKASQCVSEGLKNLKNVKGISYDTLFFQLNAELAEYYRRTPNKLNLAEKHFKICYDFLLKKKWLEQKMSAFVITFLSNYGRLVDDLGDAEQAFNYFQEAHQIGKQEHVSLNQYAVLSNMAKYYREKKEYGNALKLLKEALPLAESDDKTSVVYLAMGRCFQQMKQPTETLKALSSAESFYRKSKEAQPRQWINILTLRAEAYLSLQKPDLAEKFYKQALKEFTQNFHHQKGVQVARIENGLSEVYELKNNTKEALFHCEQALKASDTTHQKTTFAFERVIAPQEYFVALTQKAELLATTNPKLSAQTYLETIDFVAKLRQTFDMPESKLFYSEKVYPVYEKALESVYQLWQKTKSEVWAKAFFYVLEASKAATLGDVVRENYIRPANLDQNLLAEEATLRQKIVKLQVKLLDAGNEKTLADLSDAKIKLNHLVNKIEASSKEYYKLKYENRQIGLREVQQKLAENSAFLSYFLGENSLYYVALYKTGYQIIKLNDAANISKILTETYKSINTPPGIDAYKGHILAQKSYNILVQPIEKTLQNITKIIVSRHEIIGFLPFEVLEPKAQADYLVYKYTFSYANSATLHFDSNHAGQNTDVIAYAPFSNGAETGRFRDQGFKALPASVNEIAGINGQILHDKQATKINFQESYQNKGIIHFATHAQVDDQDPAKSFIALFPDGKDFRLYTLELYNLSLKNTQLVVLSACETGKGKIRKGEGIISLARAFQFAGCPSVITTIWNAHDESMAKLSQRFYYYLQKGFPTDEAIRLSKIDLIRTYSDHPFYWSNFILIGQSTSIDLPSNLFIYTIVGVSVVIVILAWSIRRRIFSFFMK
ncbi:hypothetical protein GCM10011514_34200 [Emticicia aquatilis]|uniref:CHAT domain-containing protein n=1 Tax=Emticicia aquatilis TaxID=1537369 RepID=A0A917DSY9_9BACT|nr:CHAT domain-containing tetratricopeptide repeat protein [Emticicia aquatilis]GGD67286.1 hypothetical protein GCM10011514_34200 [Emticicia aquatilis]